MPKVKANNITMNYDQQGTGEPSFSFHTYPPITPVTRSRSQNTPSTLPASLSTCEGQVRQTNLKASIPPNFSPTTLPLSCGPWGSQRRISPVYRSVRP